MFKVNNVLKVLTSLILVCIFSISTHINAFALKGIDVSYAQGEIDWKKVKESGQVEFAIIRTGYGKEFYDIQTDVQYRRNLREAKAAGIPIGVYHYSYAQTIYDAYLEAEFCLTLLKENQYEYPIFFDIEDKSMANLGKEKLTSIARVFIDKIRSKGYYAGIYCNLYWSNHKLDMKALKDVDLWIAQYYHKCEYKGIYGIWQHGSDGRVDGINTNVDLNYSYINYPILIKSLHRNGF